MPNIRRTFPGPSRGKQFGEALRTTSNAESEEEVNSSSGDEVQVVHRPGGKQLGAGKYLRPSHDDDDESEEEASDDEPEDQVVVVQPRSGGKNILRMSQPDSEEESSEDDDEEPPSQTIQVNPRSMGKSLSRMAPQPQTESSGDEEEEQAPVQKVFPPMRGKQIRKPEPQGGKQLHRGKQLRHPEPEEEPEQPKPVVGGGKQLRRSEEDDSAEEEAPNKTTISRSPAGGKQLRRPEPESEEEAPKTSIVAKPPTGGKQLRKPEPEPEPEPEPPAASKPVIKRSPGGGKQLRKPSVKEKEEEEPFDSDEEFPSDDDDDDEDFEEAPPQKKKRAGRPRRAAAKKQIVQESSEEEEIFGDDDASSDEELDINNSEALIKDEKDRKYLDSLTEIDREAILAERYEKEKEKQDLQKAIKEAKRKEESTKKKAPAKPAKKKKLKTDDDEALAKSLAGRRSSARERDVSGAKSKKAAALAALKRERRIQSQYVEESSDSLEFDDESEESDEEYQPWKKAATKKSSVKQDEGSDMDIDEDERPSKARRSTETSTAAQAGLEDFVKVTIPRRRLARWCNEPFFESAVLECFVRLCIGEDKGEMVYRLCEIVDVVPNIKSYKFPVANEDDKPVTSNLYLKLRFGTSEREFPMYLVSDAPPDETDVQKYITTQKNNRLEVLSKRRAAKLKRLQDHLVSTYTYTTEDIERNLRKRKQQGKALGRLGAEQTKAAIAVKAARDAVREAEEHLAQAKKTLLEFGGPPHEEADLKRSVQEATKAVDAAKASLDEKLEEEQAMLDAAKKRKTKLTGRSKDQNWAKVNQRALQMNQQADREGYRIQKEATSKGEKEKFNPYARRKVKPKILWEVGEAPEGEEEAEKDEEKKDSSEAPVVKQIETAAPDLVAEIERTALTDTHQFAIDEEGLVGGDLGMGPKQTVSGRFRKGISLAEYLERKENGTL